MTCIIVEDGTEVIGANSYITVDECSQLLANIGEQYEVADNEMQRYVLQACRVVDSRDYQGSRVTATQELAWPRYGAICNGFAVSTSTIPKNIKIAQAIIALKLSMGDQVENEPDDGKPIIQESIGGVISVTYADNGDSQNFRDTMIEQYIRPLLRGRSLGVRRG